ncbi:MAG TPA: alanine racemase [Gemmatimonadaceae bacterium]
MRIEDLPTPCLVLDKKILERNLARMSARMRSLGVHLRPHLKTAKSAQVARMATSGEAGGITVSTLAEAEYFARHGFRDILVAAAQAPQKLDRAAALVDRAIDISLITDDLDGARAIATHRAHFNVLIELDSGDQRAGISADSDKLLEIARVLGVKFAGVMTHAGHSYGCRDIACVKQIAEHERSTVVSAATRLRENGIECRVVSVGSTPTMTHVDDLEGVTEARPGVYMFQDLYQAEIGSCSLDDIAVTVLASVIGRNESENRFLVDAGALALSKDRSTASAPRDSGYGSVRDTENIPTFGNCIIERVYQEHGVAISDADLDFGELTVGTKVRIGPNHACITAAAHDRYYVVDGSTEVIAQWDRINGW